MEDWLIEVAKGFGRMLLNPLLYWFILLTVLTSLSRIKRERKNFGTKVFDVLSEWKNTWSISFISGLILSVIAVGLGIIFSPSVILLLAILTILFTITKRFSWLSTAYTFGFTYLIILSIPTMQPYQQWDISWLNSWMSSLQDFHFISFSILLGLFIIIEAVLMLRIRRSETFPELIKGSRGKWIGQHRIKKIAIIPFFTLIPGGAILPFASWWPVFPIGEEQYGLIVLPVIIGFEHIVKSVAPVRASRNLGQSILILGLVTLGLAISGFFLSILATVAVVVALIGREFISYRFRTKDQQKQPFFSPDSSGLLVLGVIQGSPAEQLGLLVGEKISKVNGQPVTDEQQFYQALQANSAFCKLDVIDDRGEVRFVQRAMYQGEHHELGILFAKERYR